MAIIFSFRLTVRLVQKGGKEKNCGRRRRILLFCSGRKILAGLEEEIFTWEIGIFSLIDFSAMYKGIKKRRIQKDL